MTVNITKVAGLVAVALMPWAVDVAAQEVGSERDPVAGATAISAAPAVQATALPEASWLSSGSPLGYPAPALYFMAPERLASVTAALASNAPSAGPGEAPTEAATEAPVVERRQEVRTDPWGQRRNLGLAIFEAYLGNFIPWAFNELNPARAELLISQISPRSWWHNIEKGFKWDDNKFQVNFFSHPFQGSIYYTSARANGYGYWTGLLFALAGSFNWECCGETHLMSVNDWVNTSIGGAAVGETLFRASSLILDNEATGTERITREIGAFLLTPTRGFTRLVTGNSTRVFNNPENPADHIPNLLEAFLSGGIRGGDSWREGQGGRLDEDVPVHGYFNVELTAGSLAELERQQPFDFVHTVLQFNLVRGRALGRWEIRGNLWHTDLSRSDESVSKLVVMQDFDYENNTVFEAGGQSVSLMYHARRLFGERSGLAWNAAVTWTILGGVKSELAFLADVEGVRERFREYDFGLGPGFRAGAVYVGDGRRLLDAEYRIHYLATLNGSNREGEDSSHLLQTVRVRGIVPFMYRGFGAGAEYNFFNRRSEFDFMEVGTVRQRAHLWQVFATWYPVRN